MIKKIKKVLGSDYNTKKKLGLVHFILECNLIELCDDIDKDSWIDDTIPLEFDYFDTNNDLMEYMGAHFEFPKFNIKSQPNYVLSQHGYFGKEVNFNKVFQVQQANDEEIEVHDIPGL